MAYITQLTQLKQQKSKRFYYLGARWHLWRRSAKVIAPFLLL